MISGLPDTDKFTLLSSRSHLTERTKHGCALLLSSPSEHVSALDLVAVLALRELLEVRLVLGRHEGVRHPARMLELVHVSDTRHALAGSSHSSIAFMSSRMKLHYSGILFAMQSKSPFQFCYKIHQSLITRSDMIPMSPDNMRPFCSSTTIQYTCSVKITG